MTICHQFRQYYLFEKKIFTMEKGGKEIRGKENQRKRKRRDEEGKRDGDINCVIDYDFNIIKCHNILL